MKWLALLLAAGCGGRMGEVVTDTRDLSEASGTPRIAAILELGGGDVLLTANVKPAAGDGLATVGEALWVRGSNFGRQPTVIIAGRPAVVLARTTDGGLVARVPAGVPVGSQTLVVGNHRGHADHQLTIRRLVATLPAEGGRLSFAELVADGPRILGEVPASGEEVRIGADGRAAYVLDTKTAKLTVFELPAQTWPRSVTTLDVLPQGARAPGRGRDPILAFATAASAPALMVLGSRDVLLMDITAPLRPVRSPPRTLPPMVQKAGFSAAALSPDGKMAAIGLDDGNRLALLNLQQPGAATLMAELPLAPDARVPVIADVTFVADGRTVWVALGQTSKSESVVPEPTELVAVRIQRAVGTGTNPVAPVMAIARRVRLPAAAVPVRLNTGRAIPLPSGASIRLPPERANVYLTALNRTGAITVFRLGADDQAEPFLEVPGMAGAAELSPDGRWLLVPATQAVGAAAGRLTLVSAPADEHPGQRRVLDLGGAAPALVETPGPSTRLPSVACQP